MAKRLWMQRFARWHVWLGWLIGVPVVMWTATGLLMVSRPIEEVRGEHLRKPMAAQPIPPGTQLLALPPADNVTEITQRMRGGRLEYIATLSDGRKIAYNLSDNRPVGARTPEEAAAIVRHSIVGGEKIEVVNAFTADAPPFDFRRPVDGYQVELESGTRVYVEKATGDIAAVRTGWWRVFDFAWGLHIMDLETREDSSHPVLILFALLALVGTMLGCVLMFRRRRAKTGP